MHGIARMGGSMAQKARKRRESFGALRTLPSGRHQASYVGADGSRYVAPQTFDNLTDARGWLAIQRAAIAKGDWSEVIAERQSSAKATRADTFGTFSAQWLDTRTNRHGEGLRPRTRAEYERLLSGPLAEFEPLRLAALTPAKVRGWYSIQTTSGRRTQAARSYGLLKSILTTAVQDGRLASNPCLIRGAQNATTGKVVLPPTSAQLAVMIDHITDRYKAALIIAAWGAIRYGELTELRRKDLAVAPDGIVINVVRAVTHTTGLGFTVGKTKSAAGVRSVVLPPHVAKFVSDHLAKYTSPDPDALLFPAADGTSHLAQSTLAKHFQPARAAAGRPDMPFHALRHYGLTKYAQTGATLREIQDRAGHSTVAAAMRYQHAAGRDAELAARMSALADPDIPVA